MTRTVGITGANGYLGAVVARAFRARGDAVIPLVRDGNLRGDGSRSFDLADRVGDGVLAGVDVLVHCAYDLCATRRRAIWRVNVGGTRRLLEAADRAGVPTRIVVSSIAAFEGTRQLYGQAKLSIERLALQHAATAVRPGLVFGPGAGGMIGSLRAVARLPMLPVPAAGSPQYCVHEDDLAAVLVALAELPPLPAPLTVAHPEPVSMRRVMERLAAEEGRAPRLVPVPWLPLYMTLRAVELVPARVVPFRSDSLWGLSHPPPPPDASATERSGIPLRPFDS